MKDAVTNKVQEFRDRAEVTQENLAMEVGVTRQTIIAIEKGNYTPSVSLALRIANYFKVPLEVLFKLEERK
jgi:putative transcriptional regulator